MTQAHNKTDTGPAAGGRVCKKCGVFKLAADLCRAASCVGGVRQTCKECWNANRRAEFVATPEHRARVNAWRAANPERAKEHERAFHAKNREKRNEASRIYREANREKMRALNRAWTRRNLDKCGVYKADRRAAKKQATPSWARSEFDQFVISEAFSLAQLRTKVCGQKWHVDHIVPLQSPLVCGFHCAANVQVITATQNHIKRNLVWPDMP